MLAKQMQVGLVPELHQLIRLAIPITLGLVARMAMSIVDAIMCGNYNTEDLAAVGLAGAIWFPIFVLAYGMQIMLTADVSKHNAKGDVAGVKQSLKNYLFLSFYLSVFLIVSIILCSRGLALLDIETDVVAIAQHYIIALAFGVPGILIFNVFRSYFQGFGDIRSSMYISVISLLLNIPLNYLLIYGHFGFPELGGLGAGITTALINTMSGIALVAYFLLKKNYRRYRISLSSPTYRALINTLKICLPSGLAFFIEIVFLDMMAVILATLGTEIIAAHHIMLSIVTIIYTIVTGIASAATVRVSRYLGSGDHLTAAFAGRVAIGSVILLSLFIGFLLYLFSVYIFSLYTSDAIVLGIIVNTAWLLCLFQFFDSTQMIVSGVLRGMHDTKTVFYAPLIGYWGVGLPTALVLGLTDWVANMQGILGIWVGLICGLAVNSILLYSVLQIRHRRQRLAFQAVV